MTRARPRPRVRNSRPASPTLQTRESRTRDPRVRHLGNRTLPAVLLLCAELAHLTAAVAEWPAAPARGLFHVLTAAALGVLTTAVYYGQSRLEPIAAIALTLAIPIIWLSGTPLYQDFPVIAAVAVALLEITVAGLLSAGVAIGARSPRRARG